MTLKQFDPGGHAVLLAFGQAVPPIFEFLREFDLIFHGRIIISMECQSQAAYSWNPRR
jgi:hypothetical protein